MPVPRAERRDPCSCASRQTADSGKGGFAAILTLFHAAADTAYAYDLDSNRTAFTDAESQTTGWQYDALNRATQKTYPDQASASNTPTTRTATAWA